MEKSLDEKYDARVASVGQKWSKKPEKGGKNSDFGNFGIQFLKIAGNGTVKPTHSMLRASFSRVFGKILYIFA